MRELSLVSSAWRDIRVGFWQFVAFDLFYKILATTALAPLATWATARLLSLAGPSVSNEHIITFLLSPLGLVTLLFSGTVILATIYAEDAGLAVLARDIAAGKKTSALKGLWVTLKSWHRLLGVGLMLVTLYALALSPCVLLAGFTYKFLLTGSDINYILTEKPREFWVAAAVALIVVACGLLITVRLIGLTLFVIPNTMLGRTRPLAALRDSARQAKSAWTRVVATVVAWNALILAVSLLGAFTLNHGADLVLNWVDERLGLAIIVTATIGLLYLGGAYFLSFFWVVGHVLLVNHLRLELLSVTGVDPELALSVDEAHGSESRVYRLAPVVSIVILASSCAISAYAFFDNVDLDHQVAVTAHRGSSRVAPENSLSAIEQAVEDGADYAEIDVQETADGVVVLLHDKDLMRVAGVDHPANELTYEEIRELDAGTWFSTRFTGERIPTLQEAIELARGRIGLQIELKPQKPGTSLAERVVEIINAEAYGDEAQIMSLDFESVARVRELDPDLQTGYLVFRSLTDPSRLDVDYLSFNSWMATESLINTTRRRGKEVHVWTVDDRRSMNRFIDLGVDNLVTNYPATLRALIDERAELTDLEKMLLMFRNWLRQ